MVLVSSSACSMYFSIVCSTYATDTDGSFPVTVEIKDLSMESLKYKVNGSARTTTLLFEYKVKPVDEIRRILNDKSGMIFP